MAVHTQVRGEIHLRLPMAEKKGEPQLSLGRQLEVRAYFDTVGPPAQQFPSAAIFFASLPLLRMIIFFFMVNLLFVKFHKNG